MYFTNRTTRIYWRIRGCSLGELGLPEVGRQGREKTYFSFKVISFITENEILNSITVFLGYILFHYNFFFQKLMIPQVRVVPKVPQVPLALEVPRYADQ